MFSAQKKEKSESSDEKAYTELRSKELGTFGGGTDKSIESDM